MNKEKIILIFILLVSFFVRIYNYNYPPLLWDEAALGYNSFSILNTGRDEYGQALPLIFKSFGDYKPGLYVYLTLPFVAFLGLNPLAVRLPSIILGSLLPLFAYLIVKKNHPGKILPLLFAAIISLNPYNIHYSRGAWETNILTFELLLASHLFLNKKYFWSSILFGLTLFTYQSGKLTSLLLIGSLILITYTKKYFSKGFILKFILPLFVFSLPILYGLLFQHQGNRLEVVSLFSYPRSVEEQKTIINEGGQFDYNIFHNQSLFFIKNFLNRYFNHFSPQFLLTQGDWQNPRHSAPYTGVLLLPSVIFMIIGFYRYLINSKNSLSTYFLFWLLLSPIPAALTRDSLQATRIMSFSLPLCFFAALGFEYVITSLSSKRGIFGKVVLLTIIATYTLSFVYYADLYLNHMVKKSPQDWLFGYKEATEFVISGGSDKTIYFTPFYGQPYIYYLFYSKYQPKFYQAQAKLETNTVDTGIVSKIDNIKFETPNYNYIKNLKSLVLAVFSYDDAVRQGVDLNQLIPLSPINNTATFYGYKNF